MKTRNGFVSNSSSASFVLIGFEVDSLRFSREDILQRICPGKIPPKPETEKKRGCTHLEIEALFCPECGKSMWIEDVEAIDKWEYRIEDLYYDLQREGDIVCIKNDGDGGAPAGKMLIGAQIARWTDVMEGVNEFTFDLSDQIDEIEKIREQFGLEKDLKIKIYGGTENC